MAKTLVLYYTFEGNTGFVAQELQKSHDVTAERLRVEKEPPRKGLGKFLHGGGSALMGTDPGLLPLEHDPKDFDNIVLAYPIWAGTFPPAISALAKQRPFQGKRVWLVACSASGNAAKSFEGLKALLPGNTFTGTLSLVNPLKDQEKAARQIAEFAAAIG